MDAQAARKEKLVKQITALETKRRETEGKLTQERAGLNAATARRAQLVAELAGADAATAGWAEGEIDKIDREVTSRRRFIESHETQLAKVTNEIAPLSDELALVEATIRQQENEKAFAAWRAQIEQGLSATSELLANARISLAEVNALAVAGEERFRGQASQFLTPTFEEFHIREANPGQHGLRDARPIYRSMPIYLRPMVRT